MDKTIRDGRDKDAGASELGNYVKEAFKGDLQTD